MSTARQRRRGSAWSGPAIGNWRHEGTFEGLGKRPPKRGGGTVCFVVYGSMARCGHDAPDASGDEEADGDDLAVDGLQTKQHRPEQYPDRSMITPAMSSAIPWPWVTKMSTLIRQHLPQCCMAEASTRSRAYHSNVPDLRMV